MTWATKTTYVDRETGEEIRKQHIEKKLYFKIKCNTKYEKHTEYFGTRYITWECERNNQTTIW